LILHRGVRFDLAIDLLALVDPELRHAVVSIPAPELDKPALPATREQGPPEPPWRTDVTVVEETVPGSAAVPAVRVLVMNPGVKDRPRPAILFFHGGGFIGGSVMREVARLQGVARTHDCVLVSVDYRVSPETPFPAAREDSYAALKWLYANAQRLGADPSCIALLGDSAGGGLVAQLALAARDRGEVPIISQIMAYPMLDDRTGSTRKVPAHVGVYMWTPHYNRLGWRSYLGAEPGGPSAPPGAVPAREDNLAGLPPAWIGVGALDLFVEEDIAYAQRLMAAAVPTGLLVVPGAYHGFNRIAPGAVISKMFNASLNAALARSFAAAPSC
jgi:acetyl esterase/lipase